MKSKIENLINEYKAEIQRLKAHAEDDNYTPFHSGQTEGEISTLEECVLDLVSILNGVAKSELKPVSSFNYGSVTSIKDFKEEVKSRMVIDDDGYGYLMFDDDYVCTSVIVNPSDLDYVLKNFPRIKNVFWINR